MSDIKSLILPFFFVITFFSVSVITSFPVFVSVFVIAFFLCLRYSLFSVFGSVFVIAFFLCLRYCLFSVFVIAQPIIRLFKMQKSIIKKKQKIKFSHKEINVIWDGSLF